MENSPISWRWGKGVVGQIILVTVLIVVAGEMEEGGILGVVCIVRGGMAFLLIISITPLAMLPGRKVSCSER